MHYNKDYNYRKNSARRHEDAAADDGTNNDGDAVQQGHLSLEPHPALGAGHHLVPHHPPLVSPSHTLQTPA